MKKIFIRSIIILTFFIAVSATAQKPATKPVVIPPVKLKTPEDSLQYALGVYMGQYMLSGGFSAINLDLFLAGVDDIFKNKPRQIKDSLIFPIITNYQASTQKQRGKILEQQLFNSLKDKPGIGKLPSGVQYAVIKAGKGPRPLETDSVVIQFKGALADGTIFEDTYAKNIPIATTPITLIPALNEVLQLMQPGAIYQTYIPASQAYGEKGSAKIPPNSALLITIELVQIKTKK